MKILSSIFFSLLITQAIAGDLPREFVITKNEMFLYGNPKEIQYKSQKTDITYHFNESGVLTKKLSNQYGTPSMILDIKGNKFGKIAESNIPDKLSLNSGTTYEPLQFDSKNRVTAINKTNRSKGSTTVISQHGVTVISYEPLKQTSNTYLDRALASKKIFELSADDQILKYTEKNFLSISSIVDPDKTIEYGKFGPLKMQFGPFETTYNYNDGVLISEITRREAYSSVISEKIYDNYTLDECGNWTFREVYDEKAEINPISERRIIKYFSECK